MGSLSNESFAEFLDSLKQAGVTISNEKELRERLAEVEYWRYAFMTLAANGRPLGIRFEAAEGSNDEEIRRTLNRYQFPEITESILSASLKAEH